MSKIKIRDIKELQAENLPKSTLTPLKKKKNAQPATASKKIKLLKLNNEAVLCDSITTQVKTSTKKFTRSALKDTLSNQKLIDSYFTPCPKSYDIKYTKEQLSSFGKARAQTLSKKTKLRRHNSGIEKCAKSPKRLKVRRKRLFTDSTELSAGCMSIKNLNKGANKLESIECITIDSDSEYENNKKNDIANQNTNVSNILPANSNSTRKSESSDNCNSSLSFGLKMTKTSCKKTNSISKSNTTTSGGSISKSKTKICPPYKIIENTTFAVDAFQYGYLENVTHYFLTHFHADHYIGLTKSFNMPLFMSPITARLLRTFIPIQEQYIHELELNQPYTINGLEVTALNANHCPGSILLVFKFLDTNKCILHTGDFRACHEMESEPIFWNNDMHTIYLDTTYISDKYAFCSQHESIMKAQDLIEKFINKNAGKRILYICGSYIIGKEKFWSSLAEKYEMKVWAEGNRYKALKAINDEQLNRLLVENSNEANMHVIPMGKLSYLELVEYFKPYEQKYDVIFAIRPSGWEKNTKPRYGTKINIIGIEYSEHSSYEEMQRFVKFLKPKQVISTVPSGKDLMKTSKVPLNWYKYEKLQWSSNYQPTIDSFLTKTPQRKPSKRLFHINKSGLENFVSPLKHINLAPNEVDSNFYQDKAISIISSKPTELNEENEESLKGNKVINLRNNKNTAQTKINTTMLTSNSSEDFEKIELVNKTKKLQRKKTNISEEYFDELDMKVTKKNKRKIEKNLANGEIQTKRAIKFNSTIPSKNSSDEFEYIKKQSISCNKRNELNISTPCKETKPSTNTQTIIMKTILQQREDIDRINCSQLAGLIVETVNKQNPNYCKDHIPADLLSDADDDWMM